MDSKTGEYREEKFIIKLKTIKYRISDKIKITESILSKTDDSMYCVVSRTQYSGPKDYNT